MKHLIFLISSLFLLLIPLKEGFCVEGDLEAGAQVNALISPSRDIYGGGAELFVRYDVLDGLYLSAGAGFYGARDTQFSQSLGLYTVRLGAFYMLDILEWVPAIGLHASKMFSEAEHVPWMKSAKHGFALDIDALVQYRGFSHLNISAGFTYHVVFHDPDYMTFGIGLSWRSDDF